MRQIDLKNYSVPVRNEKGKFVELPYEVKDSLVELLLSRDLRLSGRELLKNNDIAKKINDCPDGSILMEEEEWNHLVQAAEQVKGLGRTDVELMNRIFEAPKVEVEVKK
jgi:hypothetical protein